MVIQPSDNLPPVAAARLAVAWPAVRRGKELPPVAATLAADGFGRQVLHDILEFAL